MTVTEQAQRYIVQPREPAALRIERLSVWYGRQQAIRDITFSIPARRITAIIGPSGCGKSTLLRALNGLIPRSYK
ncbi:MAG: ATP-binding cassette domain-containing protein, partial [Thermomicrobium sp.]|nr:ATP-binding cassette domain-containing protein [Thermomicrobium sp.]